MTHFIIKKDVNNTRLYHKDFSQLVNLHKIDIYTSWNDDTPADVLNLYDSLNDMTKINPRRSYI